MRHGLPYTIGTALLLIYPTHNIAGPFAPAAGSAGSDAMSMNDARITSWATGYKDYLPGTNLDSEWSDPNKALGKAQGNAFDIVSLGRGGQITLTFDRPIINGVGEDFSIFENSFSDTFLELAWVEVSSDGDSFFRFPGLSIQGIDLTDPTNRDKDVPINAFGNSDPTNIDGLAGKYRQGWGSVFDLDIFENTSGIDTNNVNFIRLIDIIGDGTTLDNHPNSANVPGIGQIPYGPFPIYDPFPTNGSAGFDLDAVGLVHAGDATVVPLPASAWLFVTGLFGLTRFLRKNNPA